MPEPEHELPPLHDDGSLSTAKQSELEAPPAANASAPQVTISEVLMSVAEAALTLAGSLDSVHEVAKTMEPVLVKRTPPSLTMIDRLNGFDLAGMSTGAMKKLEEQFHDRLPASIDSALNQYRGNH